MNDENVFFRRLLAVGPALPPRVRAALAAAAAERVISAIEASSPAHEALERALEVTWSFALGEAVPFDLHRALRARLEDLVDEHEVDATLGRALADALSILDPARDADAVAWCLERAIDRAASRRDALAWSRDALDRAASMEEAAITRAAFGPVDPGAEARAARVSAWREAHPPEVWREPSGIPERFVVLEVGRAPGLVRGGFSGPGHALLGLFTRDGDSPGFSLPDAVAYGMTPDERTLYVWRVVRLPMRAGASEQEQRWYLERHAWPERALEARHVVQDRETVRTCTPVRLDVPREGSGRVLVLRVAGDGVAPHVYVVDTPDGTVETSDRGEAMRLARESWPAHPDDQAGTTTS